MSRQVQVRMEMVGEVVTGGWCGPCALPSIVEQLFLIRFASSGKIAGSGLVRVCADCGVRA